MVKVDEGVHRWRAVPGPMLAQLCQTAYEVLHSEETSVTELTGQHLKQSYQNICAVHLLVEAEDALSVECQAFDWLMCHLLRIRNR